MSRILRDYTLDVYDEIVQFWLKNQEFKVNSLLTLLITFLIMLIIKVFKMNFKMGLYKFSTTSSSSESVSSTPMSKSGDKEIKPNSSEKEYYSFLK
jgi:hypothetical protein